MSIPILMESSYPVEVPDISHYQFYTPSPGSVRKKIDFVAAKNTRPSIRAFMVKASEGDWSGYLPSDFIEQGEGVISAGMPCIPYHFWHYEASPLNQAKRFFNVVQSLSVKPKRIMMDIEDVDNTISRNPGRVLLVSEYPVWTVKAKLIARHVRNSLDAIAQLFGIDPLWYGGEWYQGWWTWLAGTTYDGTPAIDMSWIRGFNLHCASYTKPWMYLCYGFEKALFWQWTSTPPLALQINGFPNPGSLDMNYFIGTVAEFDAWIGNGPIIIEPIKTIEERLEDHERRIAALEAKNG